MAQPSEVRLLINADSFSRAPEAIQLYQQIQKTGFYFLP
jgi:hypothetical protein